MRATIDFGILCLATHRAYGLWQKNKRAYHAGEHGTKTRRKAHVGCLVSRADYDAARLKEQCARNRAWMHGP